MKIVHCLSRSSALLAATLILPALAYAGHDNDKNKDKDFDRDNHWRVGNDQHHQDVPVQVISETGEELVLIPFVGAVVLLPLLQLLRVKGRLKKGSRSTSAENLKFIARSAKIPERHEDGYFDFISETCWKVTVFYKRGRFCYIDCFTAPTGQRFEIDGSNPVLWWDWGALR